MATTETATEVEAEPALEVEPQFPPHRITIDRYERLVEAGVYGPDDPIFLWDGRLVEKLGKGRSHVIAQLALFHLLNRLLPDGYHVEQESPIALVDDHMPEPDLAVVRGTARDYRERAPSGGQVALLVEMADASVTLDSVTKKRAYAGNGIAVYWIVNIPQNRIEVYGSPTGPAEAPAYGEHRFYGPDDEVPVVLDGHEVGRVVAREVLP